MNDSTGLRTLPTPKWADHPRIAAALDAHRALIRYRAALAAELTKNLERSSEAR